MENRPTNQLTTPAGKQLELKTYMTAGERNQLRAVYLQSVKVKAGEDGQAELGELNGDVVERAERKIIELLVVSYDGSNENILGRLLNATPEEYDFVVTESNKTGNLTKSK